jgi:hypothetical protein
MLQPLLHLLVPRCCWQAAISYSTASMSAGQSLAEDIAQAPVRRGKVAGGTHCTQRPGSSSGMGMGSGPSRMAPARRGTGPGGGPAQRPMAYTCYLCGQQYGSKSLPIHIPQCQEKWLKTESVKPKNERRRLPESPLDPNEALPTDAEAIDVFNAAMFDTYNGVSLCQCTHCGRSFHSEAYKRHQKLCTAETPGGPHSKLKAGKTRGMGSGPSRMASGGEGPGGGPTLKPRAYTCYLCGQQYGSQR